MRVPAITAAVLLALVAGGLTWRLTATTTALAEQEQQVRRLTTTVAAQSNQELQVRALTAALAAQSSREIPAATSTQTVPDNEVYTLYRSSPAGTDLRVHVGTFDTRSMADPARNKEYNYEMCSDAQLNFNERNKGNAVRFWCEEGRFREKLPQT